MENLEELAETYLIAKLVPNHFYKIMYSNKCYDGFFSDKEGSQKLREPFEIIVQYLRAVTVITDNSISYEMRFIPSCLHLNIYNNGAISKYADETTLTLIKKIDMINMCICHVKNSLPTGDAPITSEQFNSSGYISEIFFNGKEIDDIKKELTVYLNELNNHDDRQFFQRWAATIDKQTVLPTQNDNYIRKQVETFCKNVENTLNPSPPVKKSKRQRTPDGEESTINEYLALQDEQTQTDDMESVGENEITYTDDAQITRCLSIPLQTWEIPLDRFSLKSDCLYLLKTYRDPVDNNNSKNLELNAPFCDIDAYIPNFIGYLVYVVADSTNAKDRNYHLYYFGIGMNDGTWTSHLHAMKDEFVLNVQPKLQKENAWFAKEISYKNKKNLKEILTQYSIYYKEFCNNTTTTWNERSNLDLTMYERLQRDDMKCLEMYCKAAIPGYFCKTRVPTTLFRENIEVIVPPVAVNNGHQLPTKDELNAINLLKLIYARLDTVHDFFPLKTISNTSEAGSSEETLEDKKRKRKDYIAKKIYIRSEMRQFLNENNLINENFLRGKLYELLLAKKVENVKALTTMLMKTFASKDDDNAIELIDRLYNLLVECPGMAIGSHCKEKRDKNCVVDGTIVVRSSLEDTNIIEYFASPAIPVNKLFIHIDTVPVGSKFNRLNKFIIKKDAANPISFNYECGVVTNWDAASKKECNTPTPFPEEDMRNEIDYIMFSGIVDKKIFKLQNNNVTFSTEIGPLNFDKSVGEQENADTIYTSLPYLEKNYLEKEFFKNINAITTNSSIELKDKVHLFFDIKRSGDGFQRILVNHLNNTKTDEIRILLTNDKMNFLGCRLLQVPCILDTGLYFIPPFVKNKEINRSTNYIDPTTLFDDIYLFLTEKGDSNMSLNDGDDTTIDTIETESSVTNKPKIRKLTTELKTKKIENNIKNNIKRKITRDGLRSQHRAAQPTRGQDPMQVAPSVALIPSPIPAQQIHGQDPMQVAPSVALMPSPIPAQPIHGQDPMQVAPSVASPIPAQLPQGQVTMQEVQEAQSVAPPIPAQPTHRQDPMQVAVLPAQLPQGQVTMQEAQEQELIKEINLQKAQSTILSKEIDKLWKVEVIGFLSKYKDLLNLFQSLRNQEINIWDKKFLLSEQMPDLLSNNQIISLENVKTNLKNHIQESTNNPSLVQLLNWFDQHITNIVRDSIVIEYSFWNVCFFKIHCNKLRQLLDIFNSKGIDITKDIKYIADQLDHITEWTDLYCLAKYLDNDQYSTFILTKASYVEVEHWKQFTDAFKTFVDKSKELTNVTEQIKPEPFETLKEMLSRKSQIVESELTYISLLLDDFKRESIKFTMDRMHSMNAELLRTPPFDIQLFNSLLAVRSMFSFNGDPRRGGSPDDDEMKYSLDDLILLTYVPTYYSTYRYINFYHPQSPTVISTLTIVELILFYTTDAYSLLFKKMFFDIMLTIGICDKVQFKKNDNEDDNAASSLGYVTDSDEEISDDELEVPRVPVEGQKSVNDNMYKGGTRSLLSYHLRYYPTYAKLYYDY